MENIIIDSKIEQIEIDEVRISFLDYLNKNPEILNNVIEDIIEDKGMAKAIEEGLLSENSSFNEVYNVLGIL